MRLILAMLVALVQVAGPWLCCCGPARLFAAAPAPVVATTAQAGPEPEPACPHCKAAKQQASPAPAKHAPCPDNRTPDRCPCGGVAYQQAPAVVSDTGSDLRFEPSTTVATFLTVAELLPPCLPADVGVTGGLSDLPFLTAEHRLFSHHALRC